MYTTSKTRLFIQKYPAILLHAAAVLIGILYLILPYSYSGMHDKTMFNIPFHYLLSWSPALLCVLALPYFLTSKLTYSPDLTWMHVLITLVSVFLMIILGIIGAYPASTAVEHNVWFGHFVALIFIVFISGQTMLICHLFIGFIMIRSRK